MEMRLRGKVRGLGLSGPGVGLCPFGTEQQVTPKNVSDDDDTGNTRVVSNEAGRAVCFQQNRRKDAEQGP